MTLALRLLIALGLLSLVATGIVGFGAREAWRRAEEQRFDDQLEAAKQGVFRELQWESSQLRGLLRAKCAHDTYIDQTLVELEAGELDQRRRLANSLLVPEEMKALGLDELLLFTNGGEILGAGHDPALSGTRDPSLARELAKARPEIEFRDESPKQKAALVTRCSKRAQGSGDRAARPEVGLVGARHLDATLKRIGDAYGVKLSIPRGPTPPSDEEASLLVEAPSQELSGLRVQATISRRQLEANLAWVDERIVFASAVTLVIAAIAAILLARSLARPLEALARQAGEVGRGDPRPVEVRGGRELEVFAKAFNKAIEDLVQLRKRLAVTERIAARREIARVVAHEIKNPLAPIRAAVETLRRLRARSDPAFDEYFDEATRTVLVHPVRALARAAPHPGRPRRNREEHGLPLRHGGRRRERHRRALPSHPGRSRPAYASAHQSHSKRTRCGSRT